MNCVLVLSTLEMNDGSPEIVSAEQEAYEVHNDPYPKRHFLTEYYDKRILNSKYISFQSL